MAIEGDLVSKASSYLPSLSSIQLVVMWFLVIVIIGGLVGAGSWWFINSRRYARIIPIYKEENGRLRKIGIDHARIITIDKGLAKIWYLKKLKMYTQPFIYSISKLEYPVLQKADGDLVNFELRMEANGDQIIGKLLPTSLRMANANIRRYLREAYKEGGFLQKWGGMILFLSAIVLFILLSGWMVLEIVKKVGEVTAPLAEASKQLANALGQVHCSAGNTGQTVVAS